MAQTSREIWSRRVERWADSGLTAQEFAEQAGVNVHTLKNWKWRLGSGAALRVQRSRGRRGVAGFVEVVAAPLDKGALEAAGQSLCSFDSIELVLGSGLRVRVPLGADSAALRRVFDTAGGR